MNKNKLDYKLEDLVNQAHDLFGESSIYEVMDLDDREEAIEVLSEYYAPLDMDKVERYFTILDQIRSL
jgi:hypothetical protein